MKPTISLAVRMKHLLSSIHPPLPQSVRQNQKLLNVLQTAFRNRLDEVHPAPGEVEKEQVPLSATSSLFTHQYLNTILTHPLLEQQQGQGVANRAIATFDELVATGQVANSAITECILQYLSGLRKGEKVAERLKLGPRLNAWLNATDTGRKMSFFEDTKLINAAVGVVAEDGHEEIAWNWLRVVYERDDIDVPLQDAAYLAIEDNLVASLMRLSIRRNDLNDAAQQYVQACQYRAESLRPTVPVETSFKRLAAAIIQRRHTHGLGKDLFEKTCQHGLGWMKSPHLNKTVLLVYHPVSPSATRLYERLQSSYHAEVFMSSQRGKQARRSIMIALLDAAQVSLTQARRVQAEALLDFAINHYPEFLPARQEKEIEPQLHASAQYVFG